MSAKPSLHRIKVVAARLGVSTRTVSRMVENNKFPKPIRVGNGNFWTDQDLDDWIAARSQEREAA